jgi:hypothetical protein
MYSTVLITPAALVTEANALGAALGHGPETYTVPLTADGETLTHWGAHAVTTASFIDLILGAAVGNWPALDWPAHGLSLAEVQEVTEALIVSAPGSALDAAQFVDVNTADSTHLQALPGVGPTTASAIIAGRPWAMLDDLTAISGVGPATVSGWDGLAICGPRGAPDDPAAHFQAVLAAQGLAPF